MDAEVLIKCLRVTFFFLMMDLSFMAVSPVKQVHPDENKVPSFTVSVNSDLQKTGYVGIGLIIIK